MHMKVFKKVLKIGVKPNLLQRMVPWSNHTVVGSSKKGKTYGLGVNQSSNSSSLMLSNSTFISQNTEEMKVMEKQIEELTQQCVVNDVKFVKFAKFEELVKKHMPQIFDDEEGRESDD